MQTLLSALISPRLAAAWLLAGPLLTWQPDIFIELAELTGLDNPVKLANSLDKGSLGSAKNWLNGERPRSGHQNALAALISKLMDDPERPTNLVWLRLNTPR